MISSKRKLEQKPFDSYSTVLDLDSIPMACSSIIVSGRAAPQVSLFQAGLRRNRSGGGRDPNIKVTRIIFFFAMSYSPCFQHTILAMVFSVESVFVLCFVWHLFHYAIVNPDKIEDSRQEQKQSFSGEKLWRQINCMFHLSFGGLLSFRYVQNEKDKKSMFAWFFWSGVLNLVGIHSDIIK